MWFFGGFLVVFVVERGEGASTHRWKGEVGCGRGYCFLRGFDRVLNKLPMDRMASERDKAPISWKENFLRFSLDDKMRARTKRLARREIGEHTRFIILNISTWLSSTWSEPMFFLQKSVVGTELQCQHYQLNATFTRCKDNKRQFEIDEFDRKPTKTKMRKCDDDRSVW